MKNLDIESLIYNFWLDHLEVYWTFKDEGLFDKLDFDNSNYSELDEYKVTKNEIYKYKYKIIFTKWDYSLFAYYKWKPKWLWQPIGTKDYIVVYSTAFKILEYEEILWFMEWYLKLWRTRRFDICIDLKIEINELLNKYFTNYKTWREYRKSWKIETRYYWDMKNSRNKRQLIRVYNKNLDIIEKRKIALYQDYLLEDNITRLELEVRPELAKNKDYKIIFDDELLIRIFKNYIRKYTKIFEKIGWNKLSLFVSKIKYKWKDKNGKWIKIDPEDYQSLYYKIQKKNMLIAYAKIAYNLWFCPVRVLIWEWYVKDKTKLILGIDNIEKIHNKERELKTQAREKRYFRKNINEIIANYYKYGG